MSAESPTPPAGDVFYCPSCGQKHRGDLTNVHKGATIRAKCVGCATALVVSSDGGKIVVRPADGPRPPDAAKPAAADATTPLDTRTSAAAPPKAAASETKAAPKPAPAPTPKAAPKPPEERAAPTPKKKAKDDGEPETPAIEAEFPAGTKIGRYVLEEAIGEGGTGTVYRAFDATTNRYVALKFLGKNQSDAMHQRFLREIEVQANLRHQNLMPVFDRGEHEGRPYFAMELLYKPFTLTQIVEMTHQGTLSRYATLRPLADIERLVKDVFLPVCEGIQVANVENGVIHRDLKPDNVLVDSRTLRAYVIDFGICHVLERKNKLSTTVIQPTAEEAGIVGTPRFLAPEQARGIVHERTDVWGLGGILHFCITGEAPIAAATPITRAELARRIEALKEAERTARDHGEEAKAEMCADKLSRLEDVGLRTLDDLFRDARDGTYVALPQSVPPALAAVVRKAMAPKTTDRYVNPRSMASDLEAWLSGARTRAMAQEGPTAAAVVDTARRALRRYLATGLVVLSALGVGWWVGASFGSRGGLLGGGSRGDAAFAAFQHLENRVDAAGAAAAKSDTPMSISEAARLYDALKSEYDDAVAGAEGLSGADADRVAAKARYVFDKFAPARVHVVAPAGTPPAVLDDVTRGKRQENVPVGDLTLAPGWHRLALGKSAGVVVPIFVPFIYRDGGRVADREPARTTITIPSDPDSVPSDWSLVIPGGDSVDHRGPPFSAGVAIPMPVKPFLLERYETTNAAWLAYLDTISGDEDRRRRMPSMDFLPDPDKPARAVVAEAARDKPVRGVSPDDVIAYLAWRGQRDGVPSRLPNEAEWAVAAGAMLKFELPGGVRGSPEDGDFVEPVPVRSVKDTSPYGVKGLLGNVRELVTGVRVGSDSPEAFLSKGGGPGDSPIEAGIRRVRPQARTARDGKTGFRLARDLPAPAAEPNK